MTASTAIPPLCTLLQTILLTSALLLMSACTEKQEPFPDLVTEFADIHTDSNGTFTDMTTDNGTRYSILNTNIQPHRPDTTYRAVVGYVPESVAPAMPAARIYSLTAARILADSAEVLRHDPTGIESMWRQGAYINMQLTARTQSGTQYWGFATDSVCHAWTDGHTHYHLSIHHDQGQDPTSYSRTYYCSIPLTAIEGYSNDDTVSVTVHTFRGSLTWTF
ncbi:MAG: NigD-like protein [Bacteroidaceae bacterium]|nr:NigD-like protein [Bacteroidaceae bacterium]